MDAERREDEIRDATQQMARGSDEMEHRLDELEDEIGTAKQVAAQRQDAPEQSRSSGDSEDDGDDIAGDWRGEASGSQQGEDAVDAESEHGADDEGSPT